MKKKLILAVLIVLVTRTLAACAPRVTSLSAEEGAAYAAEVDEIVENMIVGLSENDYAKYTRDFSEAMLEAADESDFRQTYDEFIGVTGAYQSKTLDHVERPQGARVVIYRAVFEHDPDVTIHVYIIDDPDHLITGWSSEP